MYRLLFLILSSLYVCSLPGQSMAPAMEELKMRYPDYVERTISTKRFTIEYLVPLFDRYNESPEMQFSIRAHSLEGRPIYIGQYGHGSTPILFWSQMHGDESTATMALLDLFNFFNSEHPADQDFLKSIREHLTLYFIPMLNPDGAARFQRRNAAHIDLNRDALHLSNPESRLLKNVRDSLNPLFGFNLHDQSIYYRAGNEGDQVALAFLAPAYDYEKNINDVRLKAMQLISILRDSLYSQIPDRIAIYDDSFEPRAFGDNIQLWGTSAILIESGGYPDDPEKQYLRELNFITLVKALESIIDRTYQTKTAQDYHSIPENDRKMMSLIIRGLNAPLEKNRIRMDVGYQYEENVNTGKTVHSATITDVGDLSVYTGFEEFQAEGYNPVSGKWYPYPFKNPTELRGSNWQKMIRDGYMGFIVKSIPKTTSGNLLHMATKKPSQRLDPLSLIFAPGRNPTFILEKDGKRLIVQNGEIFPVEEYITKVEKSF